MWTNIRWKKKKTHTEQQQQQQKRKTGQKAKKTRNISEFKRVD
jgi:hypothetical protein